MTRSCICRFCGRHTDCSTDICELCEIDHPDEPKQCTNGHCDVRVREVKPEVWQYKGEDGKFYLRRVNSNV